MGRKKAAVQEEQQQPEAQVEVPKKKSRKLDVEALRGLADGLDEAEGQLLTKLIDCFVEADEKKKLASRKLRQAVAFLK